MYSPLEDMEVPLWKRLLFVFVPSLIIFVLLDGLFITFVTGPMFQAALGDMLRPTPDLLAGVGAWVAIVGSVFSWALPGSHTLEAAFTKGLSVGLGLYGTYELTNMSIISSWGWAIVAADMAWGSFACGVTCATMLYLQGLLVGPRRT